MLVALDSVIANSSTKEVETSFSGARMELARVNYEVGSPELARPLFVQLLDENPPPLVRAVLKNYISAIDAATAMRKSQLDACGAREPTIGYLVGPPADLNTLAAAATYPLQELTRSRKSNGSCRIWRPRIAVRHFGQSQACAGYPASPHAKW